MPGLTGPQVYQRLREVRPEIRVLFVSGYPKEELARQGTFLAGTSLLPKPFRIEELLRAVRAALDLPAISQSSPGGDSVSLDTGTVPPA